MTAGMVRWGGIAVFIGVALVVLFPFVMIAFVGLQGLQAGAGGVAAASVAARTISAVVNIVMLAIMVYVFFATKSYFNALSYRRANIPIYIIIGVQLVSAVLGLTMNTGAGMASLIQTGNTKALGIVVFIFLITVLVFFVALLIFAIFSIGFGNVGGGVWKAVGILYLIGLIGIIVGVLVIGISVAAAGGGGGLRAVPSGAAIGGIVLVVVAVLCYAGAIICHGIGLVLGAGRMERIVNPVDVF
ncbi:MAG: hypothetical protein O7I42_16360 [Alphaproteobacteria bacterium]|nr:hypothetical protein [Alphaproteobacteria bacterium]